MARGGAVSFELRGTEEMRRRLASITNGFNMAVEKALREEAEEIMRRSKNEFVPVDTGTLKNSGFVNDVQRKGDDVSVVLGYGGAAEAYALAVHEGHKQKPKYLERPINEAVGGMDRRIAAKVKPR